MDWKTIIKDLAEAGYSQRKIAAHVGISQPRIAELAKGGSTVSYEVGDRLVSLWKVAKRAA